MSATGDQARMIRTHLIHSGRLIRAFLSRSWLAIRAFVSGRDLNHREMGLPSSPVTTEPSTSRGVLFVVRADGLGRWRLNDGGLPLDQDTPGWRVLQSTLADVVRALSDMGADQVGAVVICDARVRPLHPGWLDALVEPIRAGTAGATTPLLVHPRRPRWRATPDDLLVREFGRDLVPTPQGPQLRVRASGSHPRHLVENQIVDSASGACLAVDPGALVESGDVRNLGSLDATVAQLCLQVAHRRPVVAVASAVMFDDTPVSAADSLQYPMPATSATWRAVMARSGPELRRRTEVPFDPESLDLTLTVAAPSARVGQRWGDWHIAEGLQRALTTLGHTARTRAFDEHASALTRASDVHVVIRGARPVERVPGQHHVLWLISHPDTLTEHECDEADLVLVASRRFADDLRHRTRTPVGVLLQATDIGRFRPREPEPRFEDQLAIVANSRHEMRPAVAGALEAGLRPAIYGNGWRYLVDPSLVRARHIRNEDLPSLYSSIGLLLCDHWDDMRKSGFISNRIFDALACSTPVLCDRVPGLGDVFGDAVATYDAPAEIGDRVAEILRDPADARARAARGRDAVESAHTFDHRARELLEALHRHGLVAPR